MDSRRDEDRYLNCGELVDYSGLSERHIRRLFVDPVHPIPTCRIGSRVLVRRSAYDRWVDEETARAARPATPIETVDDREMAAKVARAVTSIRGR